MQVRSGLSLLKSGDCRLVVRMRTASGATLQIRKSTHLDRRLVVRVRTALVQLLADAPRRRVITDWSCEGARHYRISRKTTSSLPVIADWSCECARHMPRIIAKS